MSNLSRNNEHLAKVVGTILYIFLAVSGIFWTIAIFYFKILEKDNITLTGTTTIHVSPYIILIVPAISFIAAIYLWLVSSGRQYLSVKLLGTLLSLLGLFFIILRVPFPAILIPIGLTIAGLTLVFKKSY